MKIQILSDLHIEMWKEPVNIPIEGDVIVAAGDICLGTEAIEIWEQACPNVPVVYVAGNHEYYHESYPDLIEQLQRQSDGTRVKFLENEEVFIDDVRFLGCTLWSDFELLGRDNAAECMEFARETMNDYFLVTNTGSGRPLSPEDTIGFFHGSKRWLHEQLSVPFDGTTILVTHNAPSLKSYPESEDYSILAPAFASDLDNFIMSHEIDLWVHGHTHRNADYMIGDTRIIANQLGYPHQVVPRFRRNLIVETES